MGWYFSDAYILEMAEQEWEDIIDVIELGKQGKANEKTGYYNLQNKWEEVFSADRNYNKAWSKSNYGYSMLCCICRKQDDEWLATYEIRTNSPFVKENVLVKSSEKTCRSKEEASQYIEGRVKANAHLMDDLHPIIPKKYESLFTFHGAWANMIPVTPKKEYESLFVYHGKPLPGFVIEGREQQQELTPEGLKTGETIRTPRGNFHVTAMSQEKMEAAGYGFHHMSPDGKYLIMGNGTKAYAVVAEQNVNMEQDEGIEEESFGHSVSL